MDKLLRRVHFSVSVSAMITLAIGLILTALAFGSVRSVELGSNKALFKQTAQLRIDAVRDGLQDAVEQLLVLNQLFRSVGVVSREQFHSFTAPLLKRYPEIQALSYQRVVSHAERGAYETGMQTSFPGFYITEMQGAERRRAPDRPNYNVVDYIEPLAGNEAQFGLDTALTQAEQPARIRSRSSGQPSATGLLSLVQSRGWRNGFLVLAPVYRPGAPVASAAERDAAAIGETAAVFRVDHLISTVLGNHGFLDTPGIAVSLYGGSTAGEHLLAFRNGSTPAPSTFTATKLLPTWLLFDSSEPLRASFELAGKPWHVDVEQAPSLFTATHNGSLFVLLGGVLSSLLASVYVYTLVSRNSTIERVASERTAALQFANLRLSEDIAQRMQNEKSLRLREKIIEVSANAIVLCSANGPDYAIEYVNPAFSRITGFAPEDVIGRSMECLQSGGQEQQDMDDIRAALRDRREGRAILRNFRKDGSAYWSELFIAPVGQDGEAAGQGGQKISHFVLAQYDVSAVMRFEAELEFQARHDTLTGLANRNLLRDRLNQSIAGAKRGGAPLWVVFVDLDRFKFINDTMGHEAGDKLLKIIGSRLLAATRDADTVARLGGDEFVLVLPEQTGDSPGIDVLQRIMDAVAQPLMLDEYEFFLTCSLGVAVYPADGDSAESLIKHADIAMYRAKEAGRNNFQFYSPEMNDRTIERHSLDSDLRHALGRGEFELDYQPQVDLGSGEIVGMEALLRWNHPRLGRIAPGLFIGRAEEMGLIVPIGAWVLRTACAQAKSWHDAGLGQLRVAVNLSARQFSQKSLLQSIIDVLDETGLEARFLELELTESMVMNDVEQAISTLLKLKSLGIHLSIDDFGTGYSSLSYLRRFPIDVLKIDQSFVSDLPFDQANATIVVSIISLAHNLRLKVIAEGVETAAQLSFLREHGCDQMQGYLFSRPVPAPGFERILREQRSLELA